MAKASASKKKQSAGPADVEVIDRQIAALLQQRAEAVRAVSSPPGADSCASGLDELAVAKIVENAPGPLPCPSLRAVFREITSGCRALVRPLRIALLGPVYSYSHLAAIHRFGRSVEFVPVATIPAVFEEIDQRTSDFGLVPVENSTDGRIADTLDMFARLPVRICGQVEMQIHHALLGKCPRNEVREVYSRPQALSQCRNWLAKHLPGAE